MNFSDTGWVVIYPDGRLSTEVFNRDEFSTKIDGYASSVTPQFWLDTYKGKNTGYKIIKMKLVPVE